MRKRCIYQRFRFNKKSARRDSNTFATLEGNCVLTGDNPLTAVTSCQTICAGPERCIPPV